MAHRPKPNESKKAGLSDFSKLSPDSQFIITYLKEFVTSTICQKIEEKNTEIKKLSAELKAVNEKVRTLEDMVTIQKYELDEMKYPENKNFLVLSGPGLASVAETPAKLVTTTLQSKIGLSIDPAIITEAKTITIQPRNPTDATKKLVKFQLPYQTRTEITTKLANMKPNVYLNEALSPLKRKLQHRAFLVKKALPEKIRSTYFKNGILRINLKNGEETVTKKIHNDVEMDEFLRSINFTMPAMQVNEESTD